jgi:hypothetical protein
MRGNAGRAKKAIFKGFFEDFGNISILKKKFPRKGR